MICKRIASRKDGRSSASDALHYGEGLKVDRETGELLDKSHRTRLGNFGLVDDGIYAGLGIDERSDLIALAAAEMQANCDLNTRISADKKLAHFVVSFNQDRPSEAVLLDTEDSMLAAMKLDKNHFATMLHNDNGYWHLHIFSSCIPKEASHACNPLWQDKTKRDKVCREIELRHGLARDNGLHEIDENGRLVKLSHEARDARREQKGTRVSGEAKAVGRFSGEKTFQEWVQEIRLGDRLKHAKSWQDLHHAAAAYGCEIKQKGAGFVVCPLDQPGAIQLSKIGLKNLPSKFGAFEEAKAVRGGVTSEVKYERTASSREGKTLYDEWKEKKKAFQPTRAERLKDLREMQQAKRKDLRDQQKAELQAIRETKKGDARFAAISLAKMQHAVASANLTAQFAEQRRQHFKDLAAEGPGNTFRDYLVREAEKGNDKALKLARKYAEEEATEVSNKREADKLTIAAAMKGNEEYPVQRLKFSHHIEPSGSIVYRLGNGRTITDSAVAKQIQLSVDAANSQETIALALRFAMSKFGPTLTLTGSAAFQRQAVEIAVQQGMNVKFADPALEAYKQKYSITFKEEKNHVNRSQPHQPRQIPPAHRRNRLHALSEFTLDGKPQQPEVLLPQNVPHHLAARHEGERQGGGLRRPGLNRSRSVIESRPAATSPQPQLPHQFVPPISIPAQPGRSLDLDAESDLAAKGEEGVAPAIPAMPMPAPAPTLDDRLQEISAETGKSVARAGKTGHGRIIYTGNDGIIIDHGRTISPHYQCTLKLNGLLKEGMRVEIDKDGRIEIAKEKQRSEPQR